MTGITASPSLDRLNKRLASLLGIGSWTFCGLISAGMILSAFSVTARSSSILVSAGIVLLIALPTIRVAVIGLWFLRSRDWDFALIAAVVFIIIVAATLLGIGTA